MTVLPTILYLITGVLRESAVKSPDNHVSLPVSAALQGIKTIITSPLVKSDEIHKQWKDLICSSLASILEYSKPVKPPSSPVPDEYVATLAQYIVSNYLNLWSLNSSKTRPVQAKCYQLLLSVFQQSNRALSYPYIHALAPLVVEKLKTVGNYKLANSAELQAAQEGIKVLETLVNLAGEQNRTQLLALLVPILISYLLDEKTFSSASTASKGLHELALQDLMRIGPLYPSAFKA
eukprot:g41860.t1